MNCSCQKKAWKIQAFRNSNPVLCDTGETLQPVEPASQLGAAIKSGS